MHARSILERRRANLPAALDHFKLARLIEPGYCEPDYWVGITLINMGEGEGRRLQGESSSDLLCAIKRSFEHSGRTIEGLEELEKALSCKYVAADATKTLNTIYQVSKRVEAS